MNLNVDAIEDQIDNKTCAVCGVSLMGKPYDLLKVSKICKNYNLFHFADQCEAHFSKFANKPTIHYCDAEVYSFFAAHIIYAVEAGSVNTNNTKIKDICISNRTHGRNNGQLYFDFVRFGLNLKPTDLSAAIGMSSLRKSTYIFNLRKKYLNYIYQELDKYRDIVWLIDEADKDVNSPHAVSITFKKPNYVNKFIKHLDKYGIEWKRNFQTAHESKAFSWMNLNPKKVPNAVWISNNGVHCPCHQYLSENDIEYMCNVFHKFFKKISRNI